MTDLLDYFTCQGLASPKNFRFVVFVKVSQQFIVFTDEILLRQDFDVILIGKCPIHHRNELSKGVNSLTNVELSHRVELSDIRERIDFNDEVFLTGRVSNSCIGGLLHQPFTFIGKILMTHSRSLSNRNRFIITYRGSSAFEVICY